MTAAVAQATAAASRNGIALRIDTKGLEDAFARAPSSAYYWMHRHLFSAFLTHRQYWLRTKSTRFGRGGADSKAIKVWKINEAPESVRDNWVVYRVLPAEPRIREAGAAASALAQLRGSAAAGSVALEVHQKGTDISVPGWLAIPIRTRQRSPKEWRKKNPGKVLITIPDKRNPGRLYLAERIRFLGRRQEGVIPRDKSKRKVVREILRRRFLLTHSVEMDPTLRFYESWDALESERAKDFASVSSRLLQDVARGKFA